MYTRQGGTSTARVTGGVRFYKKNRHASVRCDMAVPGKPRQPRLGNDNPTGTSYVNGHPDKPLSNGPVTGIDGILEAPRPLALNLTAPPRSAHNLVPITPPAVTAQSNNTANSTSHTNCVPRSAESPKLVATIFYNTLSPRHPHIHADQVKHRDSLPAPEIVEGSAPTTNILEYPLEPPAPQPDPLDHLYGPYITQSCLTHFLSTIDGLLVHNKPGQRRLTSSHRCLAPDSEKPRVMEVTFSTPPDPQTLPFPLLSKHEGIYKFEREWNCEIVLQSSSVYRRHKQLCVFDMDSTLIQQEVIDEIAAFVGVQEAVSAITARAMNGELDFAAALKARVALLKGVPSDIFEQLKPKIQITPGAKDLCKCLKRLGFTLAVLSGGFQPLADWLAAELGLDYAFANHLLIDPKSKTLTGELDPEHPVVDAQHKQTLLRSLAAEKGIPLAQTMAIGDGANDIPMLKTAGLGLAMHAKAKVQMEAPARFNVFESMLDVVYLLGLTKAEVDELLADR